MTPDPNYFIRPVVGVTSNRHLDDGVHRDWLRRRYIEALDTYAAVECVILPTIDGNLSRDATIKKVRGLVRRLDGLVLTGDESNLDPNIFDEHQRGWDQAEDDVIQNERDRPRDRLSCVALSVAIELAMPILGICRGLQEMTVHRGGVLNTDLSVAGSSLVHREPANLPRDQQYLPAHAIRIVPDGLLASIVEQDQLRVNSLHNQGVTQTVPGVQVEAVAEDGVIEAISYQTSVFQLGLQWHPEWHAANDVTSQRIFRLFGNACQVYLAAMSSPR
ncbi:gamma-glutamyl-gamma-aminobutyrate hydrolase family protein [Xanthomonas fragariae]|uniref:gamma-glutamyl-gamma-aminobutyrate hydrolase n=1 Tax=Xanthomonas fragariae TaxID=48664 RepID=A0A1Y6H800_9XANT|nr:gamma-glutamyl-gamma-aminobutyrate hydrolase family protein [Xanthomonas fragariae]AOD16219.1 gamma-glutamyl-gamma-aminobutyrate hydrolase [Xanthomonas fragariae]AOD19650.1 gamma-glutamyl-gamma-aminobutyrate hydrolase [Xanthomonas fragariae]ENZ95483.1 amidotransferase [Xanthomonas fragariae LMG 25863]MBL9197113.1 gamma-glutamyl-gamma-aminobutyrate hydrolase family protein [Xanthomonas fragariae]MBL9222062.1 gamma-glutamyl-gamma-aminobutyrate hydrolase family protein [Xanthomonas fragariae]